MLRNHTFWSAKEGKWYYTACQRRRFGWNV